MGDLPSGEHVNVANPYVDYRRHRRGKKGLNNVRGLNRPRPLPAAKPKRHKKPLQGVPPLANPSAYTDGIDAGNKSPG